MKTQVGKKFGGRGKEYETQVGKRFGGRGREYGNTSMEGGWQEKQGIGKQKGKGVVGEEGTNEDKHFESPAKVVRMTTLRR